MIYTIRYNPLQWDPPYVTNTHHTLQSITMISTMHYNLTLWGRPMTYSASINACFVRSHFESQSWHSFWPAWLLWQNLQDDPVRGICLVLVGVALNVALLCFWCCFGWCFGCFLDVFWMLLWQNLQDDPAQCICLVLVDVENGAMVQCKWFKMTQRNAFAWCWWMLHAGIIQRSAGLWHQALSILLPLLVYWYPNLMLGKPTLWH